MNSSEFFKKTIANLTPLEIFIFHDGPRFYSCRDLSGQQYLVYWIDETDQGDEWLYERVSLERLNSLKSGQISIQQALKNPEDYCAYIVKPFHGSLSVNEISYDQIEEDWLPPESYFLNVETKTLPDKLISTELLALSSKREVLDIAFVKKSNAYELSCGKLGLILNAIQSTVNSLMLPSESSVRKIPEHLKYQSELNITGIYASSFGVRLQSRGSELLPGGALSSALETLGRLLSETDSPELMIKNIKAVNVLSRSRFKNLLTTLVDSTVAIKLEWASPEGRQLSTNCSYEKLSQSLTKLEQSEEANKEEIDVSGKLVGVDVENDFFAIIADDKILIKGKLSKNLIHSNFVVPSRIQAIIEATCVTDPVTDRDKWSNTLISYKKLE